MLANLFRKLWADDAGAVVSTEYVIVTGLVIGGASAGMVAVRKAAIRQAERLGESLDATPYIPNADQLREATALPPARTPVVQASQTVVVNNYLLPSP